MARYIAKNCVAAGLADRAARPAGLRHRRGRPGVGDGRHLRDRPDPRRADHRARPRALHADAARHHRGAGSAPAHLPQDGGVRPLRPHSSPTSPGSGPTAPPRCAATRACRPSPGTMRVSRVRIGAAALASVAAAGRPRPAAAAPGIGPGAGMGAVDDDGARRLPHPHDPLGRHRHGRRGRRRGGAGGPPVRHRHRPRRRDPPAGSARLPLRRPVSSTRSKSARPAGTTRRSAWAAPRIRWPAIRATSSRT